MNGTHLPIGVFDSGMGGLTVLRALRAAMPQESFIYLGDTARLPYGTKSPNTVKHYAVQMTRILIERNIKALVIACNTATTAALTHLQAMLPELPVIGVVEPGAESAVKATNNQRIAVLATETTIASQAYQLTIQAQIPKAIIRNRVCSLLVALAEEGMTDNAIAEATLKHYLTDLSDEDTILLGCTHFPVFKPLLNRLLPSGITIVDSAEATAAACLNLLKAQNLLSTSPSPQLQYLVTDSVKRFQSIGEIFLGQALVQADIEQVDP